MASSIGSVFIDVKADTSHLVAGFDRAEKLVSKTSSIMIKAAGAVGLAFGAIEIKQFINDSARGADEAGKMAQKYAMGVEQLTSWHYAVGKAGVSSDGFNDAVKDMSKNITDFQRDGSGASKAFKALGITQDFAKKSMTDTSKSMQIVLEKLGKMPNSMERTTVAMELFGEEGSSMVRVADMGAEAIKNFNDEAIKGNIAVSNSFYQKSASYQDSQDRLEKLRAGFADAIVEESMFLEAGTSMYKLLGDAQLEWTASVQSGNNVFVNGLQEISTGAYAVFPEVMLMTQNLGNAVVTTGGAVIDLATLAFTPAIEVLDLFFGAGNENITMLATVSAYLVGATMAVENFATLLRLGVSELEIFALYIETKVMANLNSLTGSLLNASANVAEFVNMVSFGEFGEDYERLALQAEHYNLQSQKSVLLGEIEVDVLRKKQKALISNIHTIEDMDLAMATTAINVSLRQKEGLELELKKEKQYDSTGRAGAKALEIVKNKSDLATKASQAQLKAVKEEARAKKELQKQLKSFENTYKQSTMNDFDYKLELLESEKDEYVAIGAERLKVDKWYAIEFKKLLESKNALEQKERDENFSAWQTENNEMLKGMDDKYNAQKKYLSIMGEFEKLALMEDQEVLFELKPNLSETEYKEVEDRLSDLSRLPSFSDGIADAFNYDKNDKLHNSLKNLGNILGNIAGNALQTISASYAESGDINVAVDEFTDSNALRDGLKNSGNPYAMAVGYASELISGALSEPLDAFQSMEANIHKDNKAINDSLDIIESVAFPQLDIATKSREHLENIQNSLNGIGKSIAFGNGQFATGNTFVGGTELHANQNFTAME
ncbi:MAG TPA: hypothetical protein EYG94_00060, partial [Campylobacterales bacterium]|nr:hypothetical protein [Campylobacterales bacterium]